MEAIDKGRIQVEAIMFNYKPNNQLASMISQIVSSFTGSMPGILPPGLTRDLHNSKIYAVCHAEDKDGTLINHALYAVVARNDLDAERVYSAWTDTTGSVIGILEDDASKAKVETGA